MDWETSMRLRESINLTTDRMPMSVNDRNDMHSKLYEQFADMVVNSQHQWRVERKIEQPKETVVFENPSVKIKKFVKADKLKYYELILKDKEGFDEGFRINIDSLEELKTVYESLGKVIRIETQDTTPQRAFNRFADIDMGGD